MRASVSRSRENRQKNLLALAIPKVPALGTRSFIFPLERDEDIDELEIAVRAHDEIRNRYVSVVHV
jgi:hypothetical protein